MSLFSVDKPAMIEPEMPMLLHGMPAASLSDSASRTALRSKPREFLVFSQFGEFLDWLVMLGDCADGDFAERLPKHWVRHNQLRRVLLQILEAFGEVVDLAIQVSTASTRALLPRECTWGKL